MGLNDTIVSCVSHYCFRVIVFPGISSRSAHCIITPGDHEDEALKCFLFKSLKHTLKAV